MGAVLLCDDRNLGREVAVKVMLGKDGVPAAKRLERFLEEARVLGRLDHPGVVPVHELGADEDGRPFLAMRAVRGRGFGRIVELARRGEESWNLTKALGVLVRVCETVSHAHSLGIVHRDLKPANVMVGEYGEVYTVDWGLARRGSTGCSDANYDDGLAKRSASPLETREGTVVGTPSYMPPEQALGAVERVGPHSDVYALGAMLYTLLTGSPPFGGREEGSSLRKVLRDVVSGETAPIHLLDPRAPAELVSVCNKAMAPDPECRHESAGQLAADLRAFLDGRVVPAHDIGSLTGLRKWTGRHRVAAAAFAGSLATVILCFVAMSLCLDRSWAKVELAAAASRKNLLRERAGWLMLHRSVVVEGIDDWEAEIRSLGLEEAFTDEARDLAEVRERALELHELSLVDHCTEWDHAIAAIADRNQTPAYNGLVLERREDLIPVGPDPESGLWEFAHLLTGEPPVRGLDGRLPIGPGTGLVMVLIPRGEFTMGTSSEEILREAGEGAPPPFPARCAETPEHRVFLEAFYLSKYEMTGEQFQRIQPNAESTTPPDAALSVVNQRWEQQPLTMMGLYYPTEAQWEYVARLTPPDHPSRRAVFPAPSASPVVVYSGEPDASGLHHLSDNVSEWCRDHWAPYDLPVTGADGLRAGESGSRVVRGGSFERPPSEWWITDRGIPGDQGAHTGLRPMMPIRPWEASIR